MKFLIIAKKELIDITRDRRTLIMMIVLPFVLIPVLFGVVYTIQSQQAEKAAEQHLKISFYGEEYAPGLYQAFAELDKVIMLDQIPTDSIESYIQDEYLDAAIYVNQQRQLHSTRQYSLNLRLSDLIRQFLFQLSSCQL